MGLTLAAIAELGLFFYHFKGYLPYCSFGWSILHCYFWLVYTLGELIQQHEYMAQNDRLMAGVDPFHRAPLILCAIVIA